MCVPEQRPDKNHFNALDHTAQVNNLPHCTFMHETLYDNISDCKKNSASGSLEKLQKIHRLFSTLTANGQIGWRQSNVYGDF